jgi:hypothetical protein
LAAAGSRVVERLAGFIVRIAGSPPSMAWDRFRAGSKNQRRLAFV